MSRDAERERARVRVAGIAAVALALFGCDAEASIDPIASTEAPAPAVPEETTPVAEPESLADPTPRQVEMHDRYEAALAIRGELVAANLDGARALARTLRPVASPLPQGLGDLRDAVPRRARAVADATDADQAGRAFGRLVEACGNCHRLAGATWTFDTPALPGGEGVAPHMLRHAWGVERMWEGLMIADTERFDLGARAFAEGPLVHEDEGDPDIAALAARAHGAADAASEASSMGHRAELFGVLLGTCADCHRHYDALDRLGVQ